MPDPVAHFVFGAQVFEKLPPQVQAHIDPAIFQRAVQGPDPWSTLGFWGGKTKQYALRSSRMHKQKTGAFLTALLQEAKEEQGSASFSFLAGFLCHYCLDKNTHPFIIAKGGEYDGTPETYPQRGGHVRMERAIDSFFIRQEYKKAPWRFSLAKNIFRHKQYPDTLKPALDRAFNRVYGWKDGFSLFNRALRCERLFYSLMQDPLGLVQLMLRPLSHGTNNYCVYSYYRRETDPQRIDYMNEKRAVWHHPFDPALTYTDSFHDLFSRAKAEAAKMILSAFDAISQEGDAQPERFGNESYSTGLPWEDDRNQNPPVCQPLSYYNYYKNHQ